MLSDGDKSAYLPSNNQLLQQALEAVILPGVYPNCSSVDFDSEYITCQIWDLSEERALLRLSHAKCISNVQMRIVPCPDGTAYKTCTQESTAGVYVCSCHSAPRTFGEGGEQFSWTSDWDPTIPNLDDGNVFYRRLCYNDGGEDECVVEEKIHLHYLVAYLNISDDAISATSMWVDREDHGAKRVRLGRYTSTCCCWAPWFEIDPTPWVQFDMEMEVTVWGLVLKQRCDGWDKVLSCNVTFSHDGNLWMTAAENLVAFYPDGTTSVVWFQYPIRGRYWRIHPLTFVLYPSMKADLIGRINFWN